MKYTPQYDRSSGSAYPQPESSISEQRKGRKLFHTHKNGESSGSVFGYSQYPDDKSQPEPLKPYSYNPTYGVPQIRTGKFEPSYRDSPLKSELNAEDPYFKVQYDEGKLDPSSYEAYPDEIEKLKEAIKRREEELNFYQSSIQKVNEDPQDLYGRGNINPIDRKKWDDPKKITNLVLNEQMSEKNRAKMMIKQEKEREQTARLEGLRRMKEEEGLQKLEKIKKAREYREQLEVQRMIKVNMKQNEKMSEIDFHDLSSKMNHLQSGKNEQSFKQVRKNDAGEGFNPITGQPEGVSLEYGEYGRRVENGVEGLRMHYSQKYTRKNPKVVLSFPVTGSGAGYEWKEGMEVEKGEKMLAGYGQRLVLNRNPIYG